MAEFDSWINDKKSDIRAINRRALRTIRYVDQAAMVRAYFARVREMARKGII